MKQIQKQNIIEQSIYWVIWLIVFLAPLISNVVIEKETVSRAIKWDIVEEQWLRLLPLLVAFVIHNYVLLPYLFLKKKYWTYIPVSIIVILLSITIDTLFMPHIAMHDRDKEKMMVQNGQNGVPQGPNTFEMGDKMSHDMNPAMNQPDHQRVDDPSLRHNNDKQLNPNPDKDFHGQGDWKHDKSMFRVFRVFHMLTWFSIGILIFGFNIAIKLLFQSIRDEQRMKELERERLSSELRYLKYQLNPHFFMNTLNNIHALVDIDSEKAKSSIIELSKLMRYVLYEANNPTISLSREVQFLENYITLMKLRYIDSVHVNLQLPQIIPDVQIPPLLFISYVENAFKHGISYRKESTIDIELKVNDDNTLTFHCVNTNFAKKTEKGHGVGMENINKRLKLLYKENYLLTILNDNKKFDVLLIIPLS